MSNIYGAQGDCFKLSRLERRRIAGCCSTPGKALYFRIRLCADQTIPRRSP
jgi:hypothetical protein